MNTRKVGVLTSAIALIVVGVMIVLHVSGAVSYSALRYLWPILIILFGLEVIWTHYTVRDTKVRYSGWSVTLLVLVMLFSLGQFTFQSLTGIQFGTGYAEPVKGEMNLASGIRQVLIDVRNTPVTITGTTSSVMSYDGTLKVYAPSQAAADQAIHTKWSVRKVGDILEMTFDTTRSLTIPMGGWLSEAPHLNVELPAALLSKVVTTNSSVHVTQVNAATDIHTTNGSVTVQNVKADVSADTTNGSVTVERAEGNVSAHTSNGSITLHDISGTVEAGTSNGSIKATSMVGGNWGCTTSNGSIRLQLTDNPSARLTASTTNGRIEGNVQWSFDDKQHGTCTVGTGTHQITLSTTNASVTVDAGN